jgi:hypothetical protein
MNYVISVGLQMLVLYGWPAKESDETSSLLIRTTDADDGECAAHYGLGIEHPITFGTPEEAQQVIDRFHIQDARPTPWRL